MSVVFGRIVLLCLTSCATQNTTNQNTNQNTNREPNQELNRRAAIPSSSCSHSLKRLLEVREAFFTNNAGLLKDADKESAFFFWGRLRRLIDTGDPKKIAALFDPNNGGMSAEDLDELYWALKSGVIHRPQPQDDQLLMDLLHLNEADPGVFWRPGNIIYNIQQSLSKIDVDKGFSGANTYTAEMSLHALNAAEREFLARVVNESLKGMRYQNTRWYDKMSRYFFPHYYPTLHLIEFNSTLRNLMDRIYKADEPAHHALKIYEHILTPQPKEQIQSIVGDTGKQLTGLRKIMHDVFGRDFSKTTPIEEIEIRPRELFERANKYDLSQLKNSFTTQSEKDLDILDDAINTARTQAGIKGTRPMSEVHDVQLQIRWVQYGRDGPQKIANYHTSTLQKIGAAGEYKVTTEWTVTAEYYRDVKKTRRVSDGKGGYRTEDYTERQRTSDFIRKSRQDRLIASVGEILDTRIKPNEKELPNLPPAISPHKFGWHSSGAYNSPPKITDINKSDINRILADAQGVIQSETQFRIQLFFAQKTAENLNALAYKSLTPSQALDALKKNAAILEKLIILRSELEAYLQWSQDLILKQWAHDPDGNFLARNQRLMDSYNHMIKRYAYLIEQQKRNMKSLELEDAPPPDYSEILALLERVHTNARVTQGVIGAVGVATTAGLTIYHVQKVDSKKPSDFEREKSEYQKILQNKYNAAKNFNSAVTTENTNTFD